MLLEDDVTNYFGTNKSCVDTVLLFVTADCTTGRSPHYNPIQGQRGGGCSY